MNQSKVQFNDISYAKIMLHASIHSRTPIHGILIGERSSADGDTHITDAIPVCHSHPTKPIIDMTLRFAQAYCDDLDAVDIVGWYTANERVGDDNPSPIAWKIVNSIQKANYGNEPSDAVLVMVISNSFESMLKKECNADGSGKGFEVYRSHDKKYLPEEVMYSDSDGAWSELSAKVSDICLKDGVKLYDFEGHLDGGVEGLKERDWLRNMQVAKLL